MATKKENVFPTFCAQRDGTRFMQKALALAKKAFAADEVPIGAVVVDSNGTVIGSGYNQVETKGFQGAHAEVIALQKAAKKMGDWRLDTCWLYVTLEPCVMCMGLIQLSRLAGVSYATASPLFGYSLDNNVAPRYKRDALPVIASPHCADEARFLLQNFFRKKRK
jgi:tRNA(adenine34) deaminase